MRVRADLGVYTRPSQAAGLASALELFREERFVRRLLILLASLLALAAWTTIPVASAAPPTDTSELQEAVTAQGILEHLQALQAIADANGGTRASGTPGYDASVDYVVSRLEAAGYEVTIQEFEFPFFQALSPGELERVSPDSEVYTAEADFFTMEYSGSGDVRAPIQATNDVVIPPGAEAGTSNSGCEDADFAGFVEGNIALIQRGTCTFEEKIQNAIEAGASAVIIFNEGQEGRTDAFIGTLGRPFDIPVVFTSFAVGEELYDLSLEGEVIVRVATETVSEIRTTSKVIAELPGERDDRVVVVGAHLDSVSEGPGINDNGSGSSMTLEIAEEMAAAGIEPTNTVRFIWFGAEEAGLLGSEYYVSQLTKRERKDIAVMLNFAWSARRTTCGSSTTLTPGQPDPETSRTFSSTTSPPSGSRSSRRHSTGAPTTGPSSRSGFRPAASSPAPRRSRRRSRRRSTVAWQGSRTTPATTKPATRSRTSISKCSIRWRTRQRMQS